VGNAQDIQGFKPATGSWNYLSVEGTQTGEIGRFVPSLYLSYGRNPLVERDDNDNVRKLIIEDLTTFEFHLALSVHERVEIGAVLPFGYSSGKPDIEINGQVVGVDNAAGIGDIRLHPKLILLGVGQKTGFGLAVVTRLSFPTGDADGGNSSRHFVASPKLALEYRGESFRFAFNGGYRWRPTNLKEVEPLTVGNGILYGGALGVDLGSPNLEGIFEVYGTHFSDVAENQGGPNPLESLLALRIHNKDLVFTFGGGIGLIPDFGSPEFRVLAGLSWLMESGPVQVVGGGGMGDLDKDGIKDAADACPNKPEDEDGFEDVDGCPDLDNDKDGILDKKDACPMHAEDIDGFEDENGCPDVDNDKDGILDIQDRCPLLAETVNGIEDADGCPESKDVRVRGGKLEILQKIYFDNAKATIRAESFDILDQISAFLHMHTEISRIRIEGHTDNNGEAKFNKWLSKQRAEAVKKYLIRRGVGPHRLSSEGYGFERPITSNDSADGRAQNRRVEFLILSRGDGMPVESSAPPPAAVDPSSRKSAKPPADLQPEAG